MTARAPVDLERLCIICSRRIADHRAGACPFCYDPLDHHEPGRIELCREGKARMARARIAAGSPLNAADRLALEQEPAA